jgi:PIN domain nuclease of toxin-antitoxin system
VTPILLDTCAVIWLAADAPLAAPAFAALAGAAEAEQPTYLSPITAWELGLLASRGRLPARVSERTLLVRALAQPGLRFGAMPPEVLIDSSHLPGSPPADPADRIVIATAREYGYAIMTRDRAILGYAEAGHVAAIPC